MSASSSRDQGEPTPSDQLQRKLMKEELEVRTTRTSQRMGKKRFTLQERKFLVDLVKEHVHVVDSPEIDTVSLQEKRLIWLNIKEDFNSVKSHNPRTVKQLKKAWENHKTKIKKMNLLPQYREEVVFVESVCGENTETPVKRRVQESEPEVDEIEQDVTRNKAENSAKSDAGTSAGEASEDPLVPEMKSPPSHSRDVSDRPSSLSKTIHTTCSLNHPLASNTKMNRRLRGLNLHIGCDQEILNLLKREMLINVEIEEIEKKKAEVELKMKEEELTYKRKMWDLEIKYLEKRLKD